MDRKPDFETESVRMWVPSDKEKKQYEKLDARIKYKGYTFGLIGFTVARVKEKVVFAFKFKHENRIVMAYKNNEFQETQEAYNELKKYAEAIGYEFKDVHDAWDRILMEEHIIKKFAGKADLHGQFTS